jgi:pyrimidine operon attenuation protein/uracil phosphoribosyltransferase
VPIQPDYAGMTIQVGKREHVHVYLKETAKTDAVVISGSS